MRNDPQYNLKWMEQELLELERPAAPAGISEDTAQLLAQVDHLLTDLEDPEPPAFARKRKKQTKSEWVERQSISRQFDPSAAVLTKTKRKQKKDSVNRNIRDLVVLALLEIIGILCILGWWLQ